MARARIDDQRRAEILQAFEARVIRDGLPGTTLTNVAEEAGLPRSLVRYFVGNRDDMVALLIERMVERAEASLLALRNREAQRSIESMIDFLFDQAFGNDTSNAVIGELWYLAQRDETVRLRPKNLYSRLARTLADELPATAAVQAEAKELEAVAFSLMSLAYGESSFNFLGVKAGTRKRVRNKALALVDTLVTGAAR